MRGAGQAGVARVPLVLGGGLLVLVVAAGLVWHAASTRPASTIHVSAAGARSAANAQQAQTKLDTLGRARTAAAQAGRAVQVAETFSDVELSALANAQARDHQLPFSDLLLHATAAGTIQGQGQVRLGGQDLPLSLEVVPTVSADDRVHVRVTSIHVGTLPLPGVVTDQVTRSITQALDLGKAPAGFHQLSVHVADGRLTISGIAGP